MQVDDLSGNNYKNYFDKIRPINGCSLFLPRGRLYSDGEVFFVFSENNYGGFYMKDLINYLEEVQEKINHWFDNLDLLFQAFTRSSYSAEHDGENNEVLEFIGDRVLDYYVTKIMAQKYGYVKSELNFYNSDHADQFAIKAHRNEKDFTALKQEMVSNKTLAKRIDKLGFKTIMYLGKSDIENKVWNQEKVKADLFEAILGAVAVDCDWADEELQNVVESMLQIDDYLEDIDDGIERPEDCSLEKAINTLKELAEHGHCSIPEYYQSEEPEYDENGNPRWECTCTVRSWNESWTATSSSKKEAKRYSAYLVLCDYFNLDNEYEPEEEDND